MFAKRPQPAGGLPAPPSPFPAVMQTLLANPAVTCVIPGTGKPEHMRDNVQAGLGVYPDSAMLKRMVADVGV